VGVRWVGGITSAASSSPDYYSATTKFRISLAAAQQCYPPICQCRPCSRLLIELYSSGRRTSLLLSSGPLAPVPYILRDVWKRLASGRSCPGPAMLPGPWSRRIMASLTCLPSLSRRVALLSATSENNTSYFCSRWQLQIHRISHFFVVCRKTSWPHYMSFATRLRGMATFDPRSSSLAVTD
jgi:hypothetical protein